VDEGKNIISAYSLDQAIEDGVLVEVFKDNWQELSGGKPIVVTAHLFQFIQAGGVLSLGVLLQVWNEYVAWRKDIMPTLPEADQMFVTKMNGNNVWVVEDGQAFTMMYPEDY
jgi:hypothetical protein